MRIFLDANILFSAAKSDGALRQLLVLLKDSGHELWADGFVVVEARRNLAAKQPASVEALDALLLGLNIAGIRVLSPELVAAMPLPDKDRPVLAAAIGSECKILMTGDRTRFGRLYGRVLLGVAVHSPRSLAEELLGPAGGHEPIS